MRNVEATGGLHACERSEWNFVHWRYQEPSGRTWQHREQVVDGFTKQHDVTQLVWYELHEEMEPAILREKQLKKWNRDWKIRLIEGVNPEWSDLWPGLAVG